jgi:hypothetical protein
MAALPFTGLETHPDGTTGAAAIINTNWARLEEVFDPGLSSADASYESVWRAFMRTDQDPTTDGASMEWDVSLGTAKPIWRAGFEVVTYAATVAFDLLGAKLQKITLAGNLTFDPLVNQKAGRTVTSILIVADGSLRTLTFPAWTFVGAAAPANIAANKTGKLKVLATGELAADVIVEWSVET